MIDKRKRQKGKLSDEDKRKLKSCIRDLFRLSLWFVRLRNIPKGLYHSELVLIERETGPCSVIKRPLTVVR